MSPDGIQARTRRATKELIRKANNKQDYDAIADEIFRLREQKSQAEADTRSREETQKRIAELQEFIGKRRPKKSQDSTKALSESSSSRSPSTTTTSPSVQIRTRHRHQRIRAGSLMGLSPRAACSFYLLHEICWLLFILLLWRITLSRQQRQCRSKRRLRFLPYCEAFTKQSSKESPSQFQSTTR